MNARTPWQYLLPGPDNQADHDSETRAELVAERVEELMAAGATFDPLEASNFEAALCEVLADFPTVTLAAQLAAMLRSGESVNALLVDMRTAYWAKQATEQAEAEADERANDFDEPCEP